MTVHSTQLGAADAIGTGAVTLYTVPAGKRAILKNVTVKNNATSASYILLTFMHGATTLGYHDIQLTAAPTDGDSKSVAVWIVLNPGDSVHAVAHLSSLSCILSGTELTL